jgi:hypothetical protein
MKARVSQLHKTEADWARLPNFIPLSGEFIIFDPDTQHRYARVKIGDGIVQANGIITGTKLKDLPFFIDSAIDDHVTKHRYNEIIDGGRISEVIKYKP